ncbi:MAG: prepilin-type N-terminal cleavage/methylation domain-containing protein [Phycisphaeraceae bacterium]|nr:prepilin-type N-terminal cleavage/methylation domain-containing protein [Phycisphaeraceae bacterium]
MFVRGGRRPHKPSDHGFTLIELLVVISIIALLISILLPALRQARQKSQLVACLSNLRQIGIAFQSYLTDSDGYFYEYLQYQDKVDREFGQGGRPNPDEPNDLRPLNYYMNDALLVFKCPGDNGRMANGLYSTLQPSIYDQKRSGSSYVFNVSGIPEKWYTTVLNPNENIANYATSIKHPSVFNLMSDFTVMDIMWLAPAGTQVAGMGWPVYTWQGSANFHENAFLPPSCNMVLADGHAAHMDNIKGEGAYGPRFWMINR